MSRIWSTKLAVSLLLASAATAKAIDYDVVYVRAPRHGDEHNTVWPEVKDPIQMEPGSDLVLLHPDGREEVLVEGGPGAVVDPYVSFDGRWIYYAKFHDQRPEALNRQRRRASRAGADIYKIDSESRQIVRLTHQEWTPNTGAGDWSLDHLGANKHLKTRTRGRNYLGYGIFNLGPCPLPGETSDEPLTVIRLGAFDYYSGLDEDQLSVTASFPVDGHAAGMELRPFLKPAGDHIWELSLKEPIRKLSRGVIRVSVRDRQGNITRLERSFRIRESSER